MAYPESFDNGVEDDSVLDGTEGFEETDTIGDDSSDEAADPSDDSSEGDDSDFSDEVLASDVEGPDGDPTQGVGEVVGADSTSQPPSDIIMVNISDKNVGISEIIYPREKLDSSTVKSYIRALSLGAEFPPSIGAWIDDKLVLLDGGHRHAASLAYLTTDYTRFRNEIGKERSSMIDSGVSMTDPNLPPMPAAPRDKFPCRIVTIPDGIPPILFAYGFNKVHGLRPSPSDQRKTARAAYQPGMSPALIASQMGVSVKSVRNYIADLIEAFEESRREKTTILAVDGLKDDEIVAKLEDLFPHAKGTSRSTIVRIITDARTALENSRLGIPVVKKPSKNPKKPPKNSDPGPMPSPKPKPKYPITNPGAPAAPTKQESASNAPILSNTQSAAPPTSSGPDSAVSATSQNPADSISIPDITSVVKLQPIDSWECAERGVDIYGNLLHFFTNHGDSVAMLNVNIDFTAVCLAMGRKPLTYDIDKFGWPDGSDGIIPSLIFVQGPAYPTISVEQVLNLIFVKDQTDLNAPLKQVLTTCKQAYDHAVPGSKLALLCNESIPEVSGEWVSVFDYANIIKSVGWILTWCIPCPRPKSAVPEKLRSAALETRTLLRKSRYLLIAEKVASVPAGDDNVAGETPAQTAE